MRAQSAPGFPCALSYERDNEIAKLRRKTRRENDSACLYMSLRAKRSGFAAAKNYCVRRGVCAPAVGAGLVCCALAAAGAARCGSGGGALELPPPKMTRLG